MLAHGLVLGFVARDQVFEVAFARPLEHYVQFFAMEERVEVADDVVVFQATKQPDLTRRRTWGGRELMMRGGARWCEVVRGGAR